MKNTKEQVHIKYKGTYWARYKYAKFLGQAPFEIRRGRGWGGVCLFCFIFLGFAVVALIHENIQMRTTLSKTAQPRRKLVLVLSESTNASVKGLTVVC